MTAAYAALPARTKDRIAGCRAIHSINKLRNPRIEISPLRRDAGAFYAEQGTRFPDRTQPIVRTHQATGGKSLYVQPRFTIGIQGMGDADAQVLLDELFAHQIRPDFVYRNRWQDGDLLMWDNRCVIHQATGGYSYPDIRTMHRTTVLGDRAF
jgi:taurine dioxygenase